MFNFSRYTVCGAFCALEWTFPSCSSGAISHQKDASVLSLLIAREDLAILCLSIDLAPVPYVRVCISVTLLSSLPGLDLSLRTAVAGFLWCLIASVAYLCSVLMALYLFPRMTAWGVFIDRSNRCWGWKFKLSCPFPSRTAVMHQLSCIFFVIVALWYVRRFRRPVTNSNLKCTCPNAQVLSWAFLNRWWTNT